VGASDGDGLVCLGGWILAMREFLCGGLGLLHCVLTTD